MYEAAVATCDFYIDHAAAADGIPYWDTGAPGLAALGDWRLAPADPFNDHEPVDSSAAAIAAQGLLRLARVAAARGGDGTTIRAGRTACARDVDRRDRAVSQPRRTPSGTAAPLDLSPPNGWDHVPAGSRIPRGESSMWGDYHLREAALYVKRIAEGATVLHILRTDRNSMPKPRRACHRRHARHRPRRRTRARARRMDARAVRPSLARRCRRCHEGARVARRRGRVLAGRHRQPERPGAAAGVDRRAFRHAARAREQRRPCAARARRSAGGHRRELRRSAAHESAGPVLSDASRRAAAVAATGGEQRAARDRVRDIGVGRDGVAASRRVPREQGRTLDGRQVVCRPARAGSHSGVRSAARHHRDRHDRRRQGDVRQAHC